VLISLYLVVFGVSCVFRILWNITILHRKPVTELRCINGHYYLYAVSSYDDPVRKKRCKKTGAMLGKITQSDGFTASDEQKTKISASKEVDLTKIAVRECGFTGFWRFSAN